MIIEPNKPAAQVKRTTKGQWQKGSSGNPKGSHKRPKTLTAMFREQISDPEVAAAMVATAFAKALEGDYRFFSMILERLEGKVPDRVEQTIFNAPAFLQRLVERGVDFDVVEAAAMDMEIGEE